MGWYRDFNVLRWDRIVPTPDPKVMVYYLTTPMWMACDVCKNNVEKNKKIYKVTYDIPRMGEYMYTVAHVCEACADKYDDFFDLLKKIDLYRVLKQQEAARDNDIDYLSYWGIPDTSE